MKYEISQSAGDVKPKPRPKRIHLWSLC